VLATIKLKSKEVGEKLAEAAEKKIEINEKRELFRPCALEVPFFTSALSR
jgi:hypothetical protein